jgi:hypothetical protein
MLTHGGNGTVRTRGACQPDPRCTTAVALLNLLERKRTSERQRLRFDHVACNPQVLGAGLKFATI